MGFSAAIRIYLSGTHLESSRYMATEAIRHEAEQTHAASREVMYFALNGVLSSVAFLEAQANELLQDAAEGHHSHGTKNLSESDRQLLADLWPLLERASVLDKFQETLKFLRKSQIDRSTAIWANAQALIKLRNYLVHYKPESTVVSSTIPENPVETLSIERQLANKFPQNPWYANSITGFVASHLSAGCAKWASDASLQFADEFYRLLGVEPPYEHLRNTVEQMPPEGNHALPKRSILPSTIGWRISVAALLIFLIWRW